MDNEALIDFCRFWLGDIDEDTISDDTLYLLIDIVNVQYPSATECQQKYYTVVRTLEWLIREEAKGSSGSTGSEGTYLSKRREKRGKTEIEVQYDVDSSGTVSSSSTDWETTLENLKAEPTTIGCDPFPVSADSTTTGNVVVGGGDVNGYDGALRTRRKQQESIYNARCAGTTPWRPWS